MPDNSIFVCTPGEFLAASPMERRKLVVAQIDLTPEQHDQDEWITERSCGTVRCAAGWAVTLAGYPLVAPPPWVTAHIFTQVEVDGRPRGIDRTAAELLDLRPDEVEAVFYEAADRDEVADNLGVA